MTKPGDEWWLREAVAIHKFFPPVPGFEPSSSARIPNRLTERVNVAPKEIILIICCGVDHRSIIISYKYIYEHTRRRGGQYFRKH